MDSHDIDLPLFAWTPPVCRMIPFPASRRIGHARHVASVLSRKNGKDANAYWRRIVNDMARQMDKAGIDGDTRDCELCSFFDAVQSELHRMAYEGRHSGGRPGGDAA